MPWSVSEPGLDLEFEWEDTADPDRPPAEQDFWVAARELITPEDFTRRPGMSAADVDKLRLSAMRHGFLETPEAEERTWEEIFTGTAEDDPETEIDERETGVLDMLVGAAKSGFREYGQAGILSPGRKLLQLSLDIAPKKVSFDDPEVDKWLQAGDFLYGLSDNWDPTTGDEEVSTALRQAGLQDHPDARNKVVWAALNRGSLRQRATAYKGVYGGLSTGVFFYKGGRLAVNKWMADEADDESLLDYWDASLAFDEQARTGSREGR